MDVLAIPTYRHSYIYHYHDAVHDFRSATKISNNNIIETLYSSDPQAIEETTDAANERGG